MFGQKNWLIILLNSHSMEISVHGGSAVQTIPIPVGVINNLEIIDRDALYSLIGDWTKTIPYTSTEIVWLLSPSVCFEQTFLDADKERWDIATVAMLDSVPFEETLSKVYDGNGGRTVIATNQDLINALTQGFAMQGYTTHCVTPAKFSRITNLTDNTIKQVMSSINQLTRDSLVYPSLEKNNYNKPEQVPSKEGESIKPKSSLPLLLTVFGVLLAILAVVIYLSK